VRGIFSKISQAYGKRIEKTDFGRTFGISIKVC
jgi:hypothetical protein